MTAILRIGNSESQVQGLDEKQLKALRNVLSYRVDSQGYGAQFYNKRHLCDKAGRFPSGLVSHVKKHLTKNKILFQIQDTRVRPEASKKLFNMSLGVTPYKFQTNAVKACLNTNSGGTVSMVTGSGKSITMALLVNALQLRTLIIVPNLELKRQLASSFERAFGDEMRYITIENIDSKALQKAKNYDCLIIDEAHHSASATYRSLNKRVWSGIYYRFFFTATPFRSRSEEQILMESLTGEVIYELGYDEAVENGIVAPIEAYFITLPKTGTSNTRWAGVYSDLVVHNEYRNKVIAHLLSKFLEMGASTLCLVKEIAHGLNLQKLIDIDFIKGENTDNREKILEFNLRERIALIGTSGVVGEGVDTKPCEYVIISGLGKSKSAFMQQVGRAIRTYPGKESGKVIIFRDASHKWTKTHYQAQLKILREEYGVEPVELFVDV